MAGFWDFGSALKGAAEGLTAPARALTGMSSARNGWVGKLVAAPATLTLRTVEGVMKVPLVAPVIGIAAAGFGIVKLVDLATGNRPQVTQTYLPQPSPETQALINANPIGPATARGINAEIAGHMQAMQQASARMDAGTASYVGPAGEQQRTANL